MLPAHWFRIKSTLSCQDKDQLCPLGLPCFSINRADFWLLLPSPLLLLAAHNGGGAGGVFWLAVGGE